MYLLNDVDSALLQLKMMHDEYNMCGVSRDVFYLPGDTLFHFVTPLFYQICSFKI